MAQATNGKVVQLSDHPLAQARLSPKESAAVLTGCRDLALERITSALSGMLDKVEDELFTLAEKTSDREAQNVYLDARAKTRSKRNVIETSFRQCFVDMFNRKVRGESPAAALAAGGELALVDDSELEESLAVEEMARKMRSACDAELNALGQRMGFLLERPELEDDANPVSPATVLAALKSACDQIEASFKVRLALLRQLERHAIEDLQRVYHELNSHLVQRQILPEVRSVARAQPAPQRPKPQPASQPAAPSAKPAPVSDADAFRALAQLLGGQGSLAQAAGPASAVAPAAPQAFVAELTRMHRDGGPMIASADEILVNVVKGIKAAPQSASLGSVDAMTIDIVAMLFDYIFDDRHIPASVKAVLGRLQIPILKVALLDKAFFSTRAHPARRLLDRLSEAAFGVDEAYPQAGATLALIERVVARVLEEFESDMTLFEELVGQVEVFIDERGRAESQLVERTVRLIQDREREELAQVLAEEIVARHLQARPWVPPVLRGMLAETWVRALAKVHVAEGDRSPRWQAMVTTMDELLWSVEPKVVAEDRKRLVTMLPGMLKQVQDGLSRGDLGEDKRNAFLAALVDCHAAAVKAGLRGLGLARDLPPPIEPQGEPSLEHQLVPAGDLQVEEIRLRAPRGSVQVRNVFTRTGVWSNLQRGTWVEFTSSGIGTKMRGRLTWISPAKGVYLFTNPLSASNAISISPEALAEQLRLGLARLIDDAPVLERAVDSMLARLSPGGAAAA
jgi:hypothetical protein